MKNSGMKLNALDIIVITVLLIIIISTAVISLKGDTKPHTKIAITFVSDKYKSEVFGGIEKDIQIFDFSSGECMGAVKDLRINEAEYGFSELEIEALTEVNEIENGILINNTRFYKGQKLSVIAGNSNIAVMITDFKLID